MFSNKLICDILIYIDKNLNEKIAIDDLSKHFYYNRSYIMKKFKKELGISIIDYINIKKIYNSLIYLKENKSILEIALKNGYNSQEYYSETFKNILGVSPMIYKKYIQYTINLDNEYLNIVQKHFLNIEFLLNKINKYLNNRKPQKAEKNLSLY